MILTLLAEWVQRDIPWAGIGAVLMGLGSALSGYGAYRMATRREDDEPEAQSGDDNH